MLLLKIITEDDITAQILKDSKMSTCIVLTIVNNIISSFLTNETQNYRNLQVQISYIHLSAHLSQHVRGYMGMYSWHIVGEKRVAVVLA